MKNLQFLKILKEVLRFFVKFYRNSRENLGKYSENFGNMHLYGVLGAEPPEASEIIKNLVEKSMETCKLLKIS